MCDKIDNLKMVLSIDEKVICEIHEIITQDTIIERVQRLKDILIEHNISEKKSQKLYEVSIEVLQNILFYAYGNRVDENNKLEAKGDFVIIYNSITEKLILKSFNLIELKQKEILENRFKEIEGLDKKALRKLAREKMRLKEREEYSKGAGLGYIFIAQKVIEPIQIKFYPCEDVNILKYELKLVL